MVRTSVVAVECAVAVAVAAAARAVASVSWLGMSGGCFGGSGSGR